MTPTDHASPLPDADFHQRLLQLRSDYLARLPGQAAELRALADRIAADAHGPDLLRELHRHAHRLAGSAGTFGIHSLAHAARQLEQRLAACLGTGLPAAEMRTLQLAIADSERLTELISDLLDLEKFESGKLEFRRERQPLAPTRAAP